MVWIIFVLAYRKLGAYASGIAYDSGGPLEDSYVGKSDTFAKSPCRPHNAAYVKSATEAAKIVGVSRATLYGALQRAAA
jgi:hypothetical protein